MALIECSDCHHKVSDQAPACVRCGRPLEHIQEAHRNAVVKKRCLSLFLGSILAIVICFNTYFEYRNDPTAEFLTLAGQVVGWVGIVLLFSIGVFFFFWTVDAPSRLHERQVSLYGEDASEEKIS